MSKETFMNLKLLVECDNREELDAVIEALEGVGKNLLRRLQRKRQRNLLRKMKTKMKNQTMTKVQKLILMKTKMT